MVTTPQAVDRDTFQAQLNALRTREKAHTKEGDAIAAVRRRLPMVKVDPQTRLINFTGRTTLLDAFEGRSQLFVSYHMWNTGAPAAKQCEGCTFNTAHTPELSYLHSRDVTYAVFCQGPFEESNQYREFMGWTMPWYSVPEESMAALALKGQHGFGMKACYLRQGNDVFETYWTTGRGCEIMGNSYGMLDMTVYGRQENWEVSPDGWPKTFRGDSDQFRTKEGAKESDSRGRPIPQLARLAAGFSDDVSTTASKNEEGST